MGRGRPFFYTPLQALCRFTVPPLPAVRMTATLSSFPLSRLTFSPSALPALRFTLATVCRAVAHVPGVCPCPPCNRATVKTVPVKPLPLCRVVRFKRIT